MGSGAYQPKPTLTIFNRPDNGVFDITFDVATGIVLIPGEEVVISDVKTVNRRAATATVNPIGIVTVPNLDDNTFATVRVFGLSQVNGYAKTATLNPGDLVSQDGTFTNGKPNYVKRSGAAGIATAIVSQGAAAGAAIQVIVLNQPIVTS